MDTCVTYCILFSAGPNVQRSAARHDKVQHYLTLVMHHVWQIHA